MFRYRKTGSRRRSAITIWQGRESEPPAIDPRRRKEILLPKIAQLALEGHSGEVIARKLGLPKRQPASLRSRE